MHTSWNCAQTVDIEPNTRICKKSSEMGRVTTNTQLDSIKAACKSCIRNHECVCGHGCTHTGLQCQLGDDSSGGCPRCCLKSQPRQHL
jgi:hypothetical protein